MKRGAIILALVVVAGIATAAVAFRHARERAEPIEWLCREFALTEDQSRRVAAISAAYESHCREMCARIERSNEHLARLLRENQHVTQEIRDSLAATDALRTECRTKMLEHFFEIAAEIPAERRGEYLSMVFPSVMQPVPMDGARGHH